MSSTDPGLDIARVAALLADWPFDSAVIGGLAMILRVGTRSTEDVDVVVAAAADAALLGHAARHGYTWGPDIDDYLEAGLAPLRSPTGALDLIVADSAYLREVVARATAMSVAGHTLPVATLEDLLLLKLEAGRPIDLDDALAIRDGCAEQLDRAYLRRQGGALRIDALRFLDGAG